MDIPEQKDEKENSTANLFLVSVLTGFIQMSKAELTLKLDHEDGPIDALDLASV